MRDRCSICGLLLVDDPTGTRYDSTWPVCFEKTVRKRKQLMEQLRCPAHYYDPDPELQEYGWIRLGPLRGPVEARVGDPPQKA